MQPIYIFFIIFGLLGCLWCLGLFIGFIISYKKMIEISISKIILCYSLLGILSFFFSSFIFFLLVSFHPILSSSNEQILSILWAIFWNIGQIFGYLLFINRFYYSFKKYRSSSFVHKILLLLIFLYILSILILLPIAFHLDNIYTNLLLIYSFSINILNLLISISLMILFLKKLKVITISMNNQFFVNEINNKNNNEENNEIELSYENIQQQQQQQPIYKYTTDYMINYENEINETVIEERHESFSDSNNLTPANTKRSDVTEMSNITNITFSDEQNNLLDIMAKIFVLNIFMIIMTQLVLIHLTIVNVIEQKFPSYWDTNTQTKQTHIHYILRQIDCIINSYCIFLNFKFTHNFYIKSCNKCHNFVRNHCVKNIEKEIFDSYDYQEMQDI